MTMTSKTETALTYEHFKLIHSSTKITKNCNIPMLHDPKMRCTQTNN